MQKIQAITSVIQQKKGQDNMKKRTYILSLLALTAAGLLITGCSSRAGREEQKGTQGETDRKRSQELNSTLVTPTEDITKLEEGLSIVRYEGDYGFDGFLEQGGADSDEGVVSYVSSQIMENLPGLLFGGNPFGCSTLSVQGADGGNLFGRNFDWDTCNSLIISAKPENGYASVSTVNMDFIQAGGVDISKLPDRVQAAVGLYAPLDGMNEEGLAVSVNMIQDSETINQNTGKPDLTTTTAVRLLLDRAADVDEAVELLEQYDLHASMNMMVHFPLSDASGRSVVVEYVNNEMTVTETQAVTNFYLTEGEKYGIGTSQSHERYEILQQTLAEQESMTEAEVRDALDSVSKDNFGDEFSSTEWSIVMNQETKEMTYFHRENYENGYTVRVE